MSIASPVECVSLRDEGGVGCALALDRRQSSLVDVILHFPGTIRRPFDFAIHLVPPLELPHHLHPSLVILHQTTVEPIVSDRKQRAVLRRLVFGDPSAAFEILEIAEIVST